MNMILNLCLALLVGNLGFRIWSYFVTMEVLRKVEKLLKISMKAVASLEAEVVAKHWELQRRLEEKLTKMEARLTSKKKCSPHKPKRKEEDK